MDNKEIHKSNKELELSIGKVLASNKITILEDRRALIFTKWEQLIEDLKNGVIVESRAIKLEIRVMQYQLERIDERIQFVRKRTRERSKRAVQSRADNMIDMMTAVVKGVTKAYSQVQKENERQQKSYVTPVQHGVNFITERTKAVPLINVNESEIERKKREYDQKLNEEISAVGESWLQHVNRLMTEGKTREEALEIIKEEDQKKMDFDLNLLRSDEEKKTPEQIQEEHERVQKEIEEEREKMLSDITINTTTENEAPLGAQESTPKRLELDSE